MSEESKKRILDCETSKLGSDLLAAYGDKTKSLVPPLSFVPTIVINGVSMIPYDSLKNIPEVKEDDYLNITEEFDLEIQKNKQLGKLFMKSSFFKICLPLVNERTNYC